MKADLSSACLDEERVVDYLDRRLPAARAASLEAHVDRCHACRMVLAYAAQEAPQPQRLFFGQQIDHFEIERPLGRGGMGEVYLARDRQLDRPVALKLISPELVESEEAKQRILVEARATACFSHPNIVVIHSVGEYRGLPYLALEYIAGVTLRQRIDLGRPPLQEALRMVHGIACALREAHRHGVLHLDLKPQNVILGPDDRPRVVDFGLAHMQTQNRDPEPGCGTPGYMAPEQDESPSEASDVWALGILLQELVSGSRKPSPNKCPLFIRDLVSRCLSLDPEGRPSTEQVVHELEDLTSQAAKTEQPRTQSRLLCLFALQSVLLIIVTLLLMFRWEDPDALAEIVKVSLERRESGELRLFDRESKTVRVLYWQEERLEP